MNEIIRYEYLSELELLKNKHFIKVLTGIRRSGKSTILNQFKKILIKKYNVPINNIQIYDFNDKRLLTHNWKSLLNIMMDKSSHSEINYVFLDEIQEIKDFEKCIITLFENKQFKYDIYITGSNSKMFSEKLATLFTGRSAPINVFPISFKLFHEQLNNEYSNNSLFNKYLKYGGLGIIVPNYDEENLIQKTLKWVFDDTINKDVKTRHRFQNIDILDKVINFVYEHIGKKINATKIENYLKSQKEPKLTDKTISKYLTWICESLVLHKIKYYDVKGKRIFKTKVKYYAGDLGLLSRILSFDTTKLLSYRLENLVYLELRQRGYEIYTFEDRYEREIDFIAKKDNEIVYYQVTKSLNENNYERESRVLLDRKDGFEKIILTLENESRNNDGIKIINIVDWLLGTKK